MNGNGENVADIRNNLTEYLSQIQNGSSVLIKKYEKPFAVLAPYQSSISFNDIENVVYPLSKLRARISELLHEVHYNGLHVILTKHSRRVAVLKPLKQNDVFNNDTSGPGEEVQKSTEQICAG